MFLMPRWEAKIAGFGAKRGPCEPLERWPVARPVTEGEGQSVGQECREATRFGMSEGLEGLGVGRRGPARRMESWDSKAGVEEGCRWDRHEIRWVG
jgi:hypothetical protein